MVDFEATEAHPYVFTAREQARLEVYRAAVRAGFYNEGRHPARPRRGRIHQEHVDGLGTDLLSTHI
jgi:hypothetical protein